MHGGVPAVLRLVPSAANPGIARRHLEIGVRSVLFHHVQVVVGRAGRGGARPMQKTYPCGCVRSAATKRAASAAQFSATKPKKVVGAQLASTHPAAAAVLIARKKPAIMSR